MNEFASHLKKIAEFINKGQPHHALYCIGQLVGELDYRNKQAAECDNCDCEDEEEDCDVEDVCNIADIEVKKALVEFLQSLKVKHG